MKRTGWRYESARHALAARGVKTKLDMKGALRRTNGYIEENTRKHVVAPTFSEFSHSVAKSARHPMKDADEQWKSDQLAAGKKPILSSDRVERATERGAAIFGNVVTFANVEPLIDKDESKRPAKTQLFDFMLGRRKTEEKYFAHKEADEEHVREMREDAGHNVFKEVDYVKHTDAEIEMQAKRKAKELDEEDAAYPEGVLYEYDDRDTGEFESELSLKGYSDEEIYKIVKRAHDMRSVRGNK